MRLTKMSLVAALLVGSSAFAIDNVKVNGNVKVNYSTDDYSGRAIDHNYQSAQNVVNSKNDGSLFSKDSSAADIALNLGVTADLAKNDTVKVSVGASYTILTTLGLENNFVSNVWGGAHTAEASKGANFAGGIIDKNDATVGAKVKNANWLKEGWIAISATKGTKTTLKLGRMELDTPLAFTEKWSVEENTFDAAVVLNQDIPDTTIVAAWVGAGNGNETLGQDKTKGGAKNLTVYDKGNAVNGVNLAAAPVVNANGDFTTFGTNGAYAFGIVNNSWKPLTAQAWYYDLPSLATAYWLEADLNMEGILAGAQYTSIDVNDGVANAVGVSKDASGTYALMLGYSMKDTFTAKVAYSKTSDKGYLHGRNVATSTGQSKLYTEAWWNYGYVTLTDTTAYSVSIETPEKLTFVDLGLYYTQTDQSKNKGDADLQEITLTASKSFGPLDATLAYIYTKANDINKKPGKTKGDAFNTIQAYLTLNF